MIPIVVTKTLAAADDNGIALSQSPLTAGNLTLNGVMVTGGVASLGATPRRVAITSAGNDSGITFTVYGTKYGNPLQESFVGAAVGVAVSALDYETVTRIAVSAATAGAVIAGTNETGSSDWKLVDWWANPTDLVLAAVVTGTVTYKTEYTFDQFWTPPPQPNQATPVVTAWTDPILDNETANGTTTYSFPIVGWRLTITAGTGSVTVTGVQAGGGR